MLPSKLHQATMHGRRPHRAHCRSPLTIAPPPERPPESSVHRQSRRIHPSSSSSKLETAINGRPKLSPSSPGSRRNPPSPMPAHARRLSCPSPPLKQDPATFITSPELRPKSPLVPFIRALLMADRPRCHAADRRRASSRPCHAKTFTIFLHARAVPKPSCPPLPWPKAMLFAGIAPVPCHHAMDASPLSPSTSSEWPIGYHGYLPCVPPVFIFFLPCHPSKSKLLATPLESPPWLPSSSSSYVRAMCAVPARQSSIAGMSMLPRHQSDRPPPSFIIFLPWSSSAKLPPCRPLLAILCARVIIFS